MRDKILIVDDVEINRELLSEILSSEYEILMAENGKQAMKVLEARHEEIAVLMLDLVMPEMDGFVYMKSHTKKGGEILNSIKNVWDEEYGKVSYKICRHHHERYDGRGYPDGLKGEQIPLSAQIVSIADVYDALVNERVYKSAFSKEKAFQMIVTGECGVFSPKLLDCFWNVRRACERLADEA